MFNAIHFGAWKFSFPTLAELWVWRVCCIVCCGSLFWFYLILFVPKQRTYSIIGFGLGVPVYVVARYCLIVLSFVCFRAMPAGVYEDVNWKSFLPHA